MALFFSHYLVNLIHPTGGSLSSDWSVNNFIKVVCDKKILVVLFIDNHYKTRAEITVVLVSDLGELCRLRVPDFLLCTHFFVKHPCVFSIMHPFFVMHWYIRIFR